MKNIFISYWVWYVIILSVLIYGFEMPIYVSKIVGVLMFLNFAFIAFAPIYNLIYAKKSHSSDQKYLNACLHSGIIRVVICVGAFYGLTDHKIILALNAFGMLVFILIESKLKQISKEYFNY
jgi:hypothetical protein